MKRSRWWDMSLLIAQAGTVAVIAGVIAPMPTFLNPPPTAPRQDVPVFDNLASTPLNVTFASDQFDGEFQLEGYRFVPDPSQQVISLEFTWRGITPTERPYQFELIAFAENEADGEIISEPYRWYPQNGNYLPSCWQTDDTIRDVVILPLPPISEPVQWTLQLRAVDSRTGDVAGEMVELAPIPYP